MALNEHWRACFSALALVAPRDQELTSLLDRYREAHRAYHTLQHLEECFGAFEAVRFSAQLPGAVGLALFYHDAIYDTHANDNEEKSAELLRQMLRSVAADAALLSYVTSLILVTRHAAMPETPDEKLVVDIDLSILGAPRARFDEYERQVRQEYSWVEEAMFRSVRRQILQSFLERPAIYGTPHFRDRFESAAGANLKRSIAALTA